MDAIVKILTPATSFDFLTLDELKMLLGISLTDTTKDTLLQAQLDSTGDTIARMCNRVFAREEIEETVYDLGGRRLFLSHWPIAEADIESVTANGADVTGWVIEERSGKLENIVDGCWYEPVVVTYWGGYLLPDDAPPSLKQAQELLVRDLRMLSTVGAMSGVRSLSHKEKRVQFYDTSQMLAKAGTGTTPIRAAVDNLLEKFMRVEA
jgi:hypothetical protein